MMTARATLLCAGCRRAFSLKATADTREKALGLLAAQAETWGWVRTADDWFCSDGCKASQAIDITPRSPGALTDGDGR